MYQGLYIQGKLDPNRYATKKTIGQGMLDIALLTSNASQLRYILQVQQDIFYRYSRIYSTVQQDIFYRYSNIYSTGTAGYILQVQQDIFYRYSRIYSTGTAGHILQVK